MNPDTVHVLVALLLGIVVVAVLRFEVTCLRDLARTPDIDLRGLTRPIWQAFILPSFPIGGLCYLSYGKRR